MTKEDPFDEKAALLELEQLRESIQAARQARQRKSAEFDAFVKGFRKPAPTPDSEPSVPTAPPSQPHQPDWELTTPPPQFADPMPPIVAVPATSERSPGITAPTGPRPDSERSVPTAPPSQPHQSDWELITPPPQFGDPMPPIVAVPATSERSPEVTAPTGPQISRRHRFNIRPLGIGAIITVVALGVLSTRWRKPTPPPVATNPVTTNQVSTARGETPTGAAPQSAATAQPAARGVVVELKTVRAVWIRVVVDGQKNVEGMIQGGEPLHLTGDHSIVVRVGNGGDVLVKTGEREEPFGVVGQPVTRTFSKR